MLYSGRLTAVVSACGSRAHYHLLSALAGHDNCTAGTICANGSPIVSPVYRDSAVLVDEDMAALEQLTVRQNMEYSAQMRMRSGQGGGTAAAASSPASARCDATDPTSHEPHDVFRSSSSDPVDDAIRALKLEGVADCEVRKLSLYARRRVAVAKELVLRPCAIFIDSPVEGLPTHEAKEYLRLLKALADETESIVCVSLMQPKWALLAVVDDVMLVERTRVVFVGSTSTLMRSAAADDLARLAAVSRSSAAAGGPESGGHDQVSTSRTHAGAAADEPCVFPETVVNNIYRTATSPNLTLSTAYHSFTTSQQQTAHDVANFLRRCAVGEEPPLVAVASRGYHNPIVKLLILSKFAVLQVKNNVVWYTLLGVLALLVAILLATVYTNQDTNGQSGMQNRTGMIFFLISSTLLHNMLLVDSTKREYLSFQRHRAHGYYSAGTYLVFWVLSSLLTRFIGGVIFVMALFSLARIGSAFDLTTMRDLYIIVALTSFSTATVIWFVCCVSPTVRTAHFIMFGVYTTSVVLAGLILNLQTLPKAFQVASNLSLIRFGYESAILSQFAGNAFGCNATASLPPAAGSSSTIVPASSLFQPPTSQLTTTARGGLATPPALTSTGSHFDALGLAFSHGHTSLQRLAGHIAVALEAATTPTAAPTPASPTAPQCFTGDSYLRFLGFEEERKWQNLAYMSYISLAVIAMSFVAMVCLRPTAQRV